MRSHNFACNFKNNNHEKQKKKELIYECHVDVPVFNCEF